MLVVGVVVSFAQALALLGTLPVAQIVEECIAVAVSVARKLAMQTGLVVLVHNSGSIVAPSLALAVGKEMVSTQDCGQQVVVLALLVRQEEVRLHRADERLACLD